MFFYSYGKKVIELGPLLTHCDSCQKDQQHRIYLEYSFGGAYGFFNFVSNESYFLVCKKCNKQFPGDLAYFKSEIPDPLKFMERYGCLVFMIGVFPFLAFILLYFNLI